MCFKSRPGSTEILRQTPGERSRNIHTLKNGERLRIGYKTVLTAGRENCSKGGSAFKVFYPIGQWVHGQEVEPHTFNSYPGAQMAAGIYLHRTRPTLNTFEGRYSTIKCAYRSVDVLGADGKTVCVRAVKVLD